VSFLNALPRFRLCPHYLCGTAASVVFRIARVAQPPRLCPIARVAQPPRLCKHVAAGASALKGRGFQPRRKQFLLCGFSRRGDGFNLMAATLPAPALPPHSPDRSPIPPP